MGNVKSIVAVLVIGAVASLATVAAFASGAGPGVTAGEALQKLMEGNQRYIECRAPGQKLCDPDLRRSLVDGQKPYAIILSCSDSRVPPEIIFDKGMGEIFVIRVAGNVSDPIVLGSIEYAAEHLGSPLIVVLGHTRCGAVTAAVDATGKPEGNVGAILKKIGPAVKQARKEVKSTDKTELLETAITDNIRLVCGTLTKRSKVIKAMVGEGKLKIVGAKYDLADGKVTLLDAK